MGVNRESRLAEMGIVLGPAPEPAGTYVPCMIVGDLLYVSGQGPRQADGSYATGVVGQDLTKEQAYEHAKLVGVTILSVVKNEIRTLSRVRRVVKVFGMVNATPDFKEHPEVVNGCSDLFMAIFGDAGKHTRSAVGMSGLPRGISVEIEAVFQLYSE